MPRWSSSHINTFIKQIPSNWIPPWGVENALVKLLLKKLGLDLVFQPVRPVSNLPFITKRTEKASINQLINHMNKVRPLPSYQSAYKSFHSTETALLKVQCDILLNMDNHKVTFLVMLDLITAFDTIHHKILLETKVFDFELVEQHWNGSRHIFLKELSKYKLKELFQKRNIWPLEYHRDSALAPCCSPSMLPTFFQIIEKRLPEAQACADEHQVYLSFRPIPSTNQTAPATAIENCAAELRSWMISNMLMVDGRKAEFQIVGSKQQLERVGEGQITPGPVTSVRNLCGIFYSNLKMDMQITKACQNAYYHLHNNRRIRKLFNQEATCMIIHAFIKS